MAAIQYKMHGRICVVREPTGHEAINLWSKDHKPIAVQFLGFLRKDKAEKRTDGGWAKMPAVAVTSSSTHICGWVPLEPHEFVLCYRSPVPGGWGAYAVVDLVGWPIVIDPTPRVPIQNKRAV